MIFEEEDKAENQLKRVDHLIYVTLKYTRTCDVIKNVIFRLISTYDAIFYEGLLYLLEKKKIKEIPQLGEDKYKLFKSKFNKRGVKRYFKFYELLKKLSKAEYQAREEYRKHVTMIARVEGKKVEVDIPVLYNYYKELREFIEIVKG